MIRKSLHPGVFEEVLYRGLLISGLKGFGLKDEQTNIIQAIIFGITHVISFGNVPSIFILHTASQIILGYVIGKVYFKTKSLTPCILLHGLIDVPI
jgi:membrane protease YdiL (CAAX protease family)